MVNGSNTIERRIVFYGMRQQRTRRTPDEAYGRAVVQMVRRLDRAADEHLLDLGDDQFIAGYGSTYEGFPVVQLGHVRRRDLPRIQRRDEVRDLELEADEGVMEISHLMFLPHGVIGAEYNYRGPKVSILPRYISEKCSGLPKINAAVLINSETYEQIRRMNQVSSVEIEISRGNLSIARDASDANANLFDVLDANGEVFGGENVHLVVGRLPRSRTRMVAARIPFIRQLAANEDFRNAARKFRVKGFDPEWNREVEVDLLKEHVVSTARVAKVGRSRVVVTSDMYGSILGAYNELSEQISDASQAALVR